MRFAACALTLGIFTSVASAQQMATAEWFVRQQGDTVQAAIEIEVKPDWYLYHTNKGSKNAPAKPLVISWNGDAGITWQAPILPKPKVGRGGEEWGDPFTYNYHVGSITVWVQGTGATSVDSLRLNLDGQTCSDVEGSCVEFMVKDLAPAAGNGPWDKVPAAFATQAAPAPEVEKAPGKTGGSGGFGFNAGQGFELPKENKPNSFGWKPEYKNHVDARLRVLRAGEEVQAIFEIDVAEGYHAYHGPTQDDIAPGKPVAEPTRVELDEVEVLWQKPVYSEPHIGEGLNDAGDDIAIRTHEREWTIHVAGTADGEVELEDLVFVLKGQVCDDAGCQQFSFELTPEVEDVDSLPPMPAAVDVALDGAVADGAGEQKKEDGLWVFLGQAVFWALFTLLMPCTYPMIPITISFFTKQATSRGGSVLPLALTYGAGIVSIFILIGLLFGQVIGAFAAHPVTNLVIGIVFIYFSLTLFGLVNLQPPQALNRMAGKASRKGGYLGVFLMGATLVVTSFTCTAPFVGTLLASGASAGVMRTVLGMGVFGLVMALPFVLLSLLPGRLQAMPKAGGWMNTLKVYMGFVELAAALKFISNADVFNEWGILSNQVFLLLWIAIFVAAGVYLIVQTLKAGGSKSPLQMAFGIATLALAGYFYTNLNGRQANYVMGALLPGYHHEGLVKVFGDQRIGVRHEIVEDNLEEAVAKAQASGKYLLVNFTGIACVNCRKMEQNTFKEPAVAEILGEHFIEARLHTDRTAAFKDLEVAWIKTSANPVYVVVKNTAPIDQPVSEINFDEVQLLGRWDNATSTENFAKFLRESIQL